MLNLREVGETVGGMDMELSEIVDKGKEANTSQWMAFTLIILPLKSIFW